MSTRYLIAALLMTSACVAHADVTSTPSSSGFLSTWTTGNGTDVINSGILSNNASLIGGVAHGSDASLAQALYDKASANAAQTDGAVKIAYSQGIQGDFLTRTSNAMLVAMLCDNCSAVSSPDGAIITSAPQQSGAVGAGAPSGSGSGSGSISSGSASGTGTSGTQTGSDTNLNTSGGLTGADSADGSPTINQPLASDPLAQDAVNVPEPSSIALLAAGLFGAAGLRRRTKR